MRIVFLTNESFHNDAYFMYQFSHIASYFDDYFIITVQRRRTKLSLKIKKFLRKIKLYGLLNFLEILLFYPLQIILYNSDQKTTSQLINGLPRPIIDINDHRIINISNSLHSDLTISALKNIKPDIIIQNGAGILKSQIFSLSKIHTINLHHGIAPLIRGMSSIYWALWEQKPSWIGGTVHVIDKGIDTGKILAYSKIECDLKNDDYPKLFASITKEGTKEMLTVLKNLKRNDDFCIKPIAGDSNYKSTFSGLKLLYLKLKRFL